MMIKNLSSAIAIMFGSILLATACGQKSQEEQLADMEASGKTDQEQLLEGDKTIYGLACEGCTDSVIVLLPNNGGDPVTYNIIEAFRQQHVQGRMKVGDWIGLVANEEDSTVADLVIDLDELKGTWCYVVMPKLRGHEQMSDAEQARQLREMSDSMKNEYFIPREYGFSLKRQWTAQSVGYVRSRGVVEDNSPVVYPQLLWFTEWHILNGRLVMTSGTFEKKPDSEEMIVKNNRADTCDILYLRDDSLVLGSDGEYRSYYRRTNKDEINKLARQKAEEQLRKAMQE